MITLLRPTALRSVSAVLPTCSAALLSLRTIPNRSFSTLLTRPSASFLILSSRLPKSDTLSSTISIPTSLCPIQSPLNTLQQQIRGVKRNTFNPSHRVRKRRFGFLARAKSKTGRAILMRRRLKGRKSLTH